MLGFDEARAKLLAMAVPVSAVDEVALAAAHNRVLACDVFAACDVPPHDNSAMDGFALRAADLGSDGILPVSQRIFAGMAPAPLQPGTAARIFTGSVVPEGADTVVPQEDCDYSDECVTIRELAPVGLHIRKRGEDITRGQKIISVGTLLKPGHIGLLASLGIGSVKIFRPLRVGLLSTGNEIVAPGTLLQPGQIYNSNAPMLRAELEKLGLAVDVRHAIDDVTVITDTLRDMASKNDLLLSIGGVSVGEADFIKSAIRALGTLDLWKVAIKPGKPLSFGRIAGIPAIGLPGNPVAAFATFQLFARPFLLVMQGVPDAGLAPQQLPVRLKRPMRPAREEFIRVQFQVNGGQEELVPYPHQGSGVLSSVAWATGFARIPMERETADGDRVSYLPFT
jgi:molybdopterin molybdotransferase